MNDPTRLLEALQGSPGDGSLWLALADHREEQGEVERAELTRLTLWAERAAVPRRNSGRKGGAAGGSWPRERSRVRPNSLTALGCA